jgi:hypothetical protein
VGHEAPNASINMPVAATGEASTGGAGPLEVQSAGTAAIATAPQTKAADSPETVTKRVRKFIPPDPVSSTTAGFVSLTTNSRGCRCPKECTDVPAVGRFTPLIGSTVIPMPRAPCAEQSPTRSEPTGRRRSETSRRREQGTSVVLRGDLGRQWVGCARGKKHSS